MVGSEGLKFYFSALKFYFTRLDEVPNLLGWLDRVLFFRKQRWICQPSAASAGKSAGFANPSARSAETELGLPTPALDRRKQSWVCQLQCSMGRNSAGCANRSARWAETVLGVR